MTLTLGHRLLDAGAISQAQLEQALYAHVTRRVSFVEALCTANDCAAQLDRLCSKSDAPCLRTVVADLRLVRRVPQGMCRRLFAVPVREDLLTQTIDVATSDPFSTFAQNEFSFHLQAPVRLVYAPYDVLAQVLHQIAASELSTGDDRTASSSRPPRRTPSMQGTLQLTQPGTSSYPAGRPARGTPQNVVLGSPSLPAATRSLLASAVPSSERAGRIPLAPSALPDLGDLLEPPERAELLDALTALSMASSRDQVVVGLLEGMAIIARRVAVFAVRRQTFTGWACTRNFATVEAIRALQLDRSTPTVFSQAIDNGGYFGPIPATPGHEALSPFVRVGDEVSVVPIIIASRPIVMVFACGHREGEPVQQTIEKLTRAGSQALLRVLRAERTSSGTAP